jgi:hypothetical protein
VTRKEGVLITPSIALVSTTYQFTISPAPASNARVIAQVEIL